MEIWVAGSGVAVSVAMAAAVGIPRLDKIGQYIDCIGHILALHIVQIALTDNECIECRRHFLTLYKV